MRQEVLLSCPCNVANTELRFSNFRNQQTLILMKLLQSCCLQLLRSVYLGSYGLVQLLDLTYVLKSYTDVKIVMFLIILFIQQLFCTVSTTAYASSLGPPTQASYTDHGFNVQTTPTLCTLSVLFFQTLALYTPLIYL